MAKLRRIGYTIFNAMYPTLLKAAQALLSTFNILLRVLIFTTYLGWR